MSKTVIEQAEEVAAKAEREPIYWPGAALVAYLFLMPVLIVAALIVMCAPSVAAAAPYMGDACKLSTPRTYTVSVDPDLAPAGLTHQDVETAMALWNEGFIREYGFAIFAPHFGNWQDADFLLTAHGYATTWVQTKCSAGYVQRGNNLAISFMGSEQAGQNRDWVTHELGHLLGFSDYVMPADNPARYLSPGACYDVASIMSYCWQRQPPSLICLNDPQWVDDCTLIRNYWR